LHRPLYSCLCHERRRGHRGIIRKGHFNVKLVSMKLALLLAMSFCTAAFASGEASGPPMGPPPGSGGDGNMSREIPENVADLPTIEAEYWLTTTEDRVGMEGPEFDAEGNLYVCSVGMTYPVNYILKIDLQKNTTTAWEGELSPLGLAFHDGLLFPVCREGVILVIGEDGGDAVAIKPGTNEAYLLTAGFGEGFHIYTFETIGETK
ncbi:MAG: hypothetical protein Q4B26_19210, partial [Eubacteriales bacterium]|nr:hypothetical protein [Eubacteriales bacterium]